MRTLLWAGCACVLALALSAPRSYAAEIASCTVAADGHTDGTLHSLSGGDGIVDTAECASKSGLTYRSGSNFLYFALDGNVEHRQSGDIYVDVEYFDAAPGTGVQLHYDSTRGEQLSDKYVNADDQAGGYMLGTGKWRRTVFMLRNARFAHRENLGADFRLTGGGLIVHKVVLTSNRPVDWQQLSQIESIEIKPLVSIGAGGQFIVGGFDPARASDAGPQSHALETSIPALKQLGVTSHECYVRWNLCETAPGKYDWSVYDRYVQIYKKYHLRWVPFLIIGSAYSLPDWYYKQTGSQGYICLEHHEECDVQSLWNPRLREHVSRFIKAFCEHYRGSGVIESILLGVTGNYGEAIYPASGNDWTADIHGQYHTHSGWWAGDPFALADYRSWLARKYGTINKLAEAWGVTAPMGFDSLAPTLRPEAPSNRAWLDQCLWYIGAMTNWSRFWLQTTRAAFPVGDIYLCTGGHAPAEHGSDFGEQCKAAAAVKAGVRITNEGSDERANFSLTRWVASAGRQYGAYFSFEPAGAVDSYGVIGRVYNASTSGAKGLHYYYPNLFAEDAARQNFIGSGSNFVQQHPLLEAAVYYPDAQILLKGNDFLRYSQELRKRLDFDYLSDGQIRDGGLKNIKALIIMQGTLWEAPVWAKVRDWVRAGGILIYASQITPIQAVDGVKLEGTELPNGSYGQGVVHRYEGGALEPEFQNFVADRLNASPAISDKTKRMISFNGDGVYASVDTAGKLTVYNSTGKAAKAGGIEIPAHTIVRVQ